MTIEIVLFFVILLVNAYLSASEIAISTFGENKIAEMKEEGDKSAGLFEIFLTKQENVYGTIQFLYSFFTVLTVILGYMIIFNLLAPVLWHGYNQIILIAAAVVIITIILIIFNILLPKAFAFKYPEQIGKSSIRLLLFLSKVLGFAPASINFISNGLLLPIKEKTNFSQMRPSEDEILDIISEGVKSGTLDESEQEIIENIFEFTDLRANEVMIPRTEMVAIDIAQSDTKNIEEIIKSGYSLVPCYEDNPDNIIGVLHAKDVVKNIIEKNDIPLRKLIRPVYFVPETKLISEILRDMQNQGERLAVVTDEYGGTEGVITMEDMLEEIVGKIKDNTKGDIPQYSLLQDGKYYVLGTMHTDDFNEIFNFSLPESDEYNTVAGFIGDKTGKILNPGEQFEYEELVFELMKKIRQKMVQFKVYSKDGKFAEKKKLSIR
jgi:putative hemolysin